jgi:hypothetical protein
MTMSGAKTAKMVTARMKMFQERESKAEHSRCGTRMLGGSVCGGVGVGGGACDRAWPLPQRTRVACESGQAWLEAA